MVYLYYLKFKVVSPCKDALIVNNLNIIELAMRLSVCPCACGRACVCKSTPRTIDVTVAKIAGYVRVRILMNR